MRTRCAKQAPSLGQAISQLSNKLILTCAGSLGDLYPILAVALASKDVGFQPVLAVPETHVELVRSFGLAAEPVMPDFDSVRIKLGLTETEAVRALIDDVDFLIQKVLLSTLAESTQALDDIADGALAILGALVSLPGPIVAEKRNIPFVPTVLSPMLTMSALDAPAGSGFGMLAKPPVGRIQHLWNKGWLAIIHREMRRRYAKQIDRVRELHGLPPAKSSPIFNVDGDPPLRLGLYSPLMGKIQKDFPANLVLTGFPNFDGGPKISRQYEDEVQPFLNGGSPPIVFTLGSLAPAAAGPFYNDSLAAAIQLDARALLLTGKNELDCGANALAFAYAPHSLVFPKAAVVVHHGGIGTTGQALKAGIPQLVVPMNGDQFDNAARIARLGVGRVLPFRRYNPETARSALETIMKGASMAARAADVGERVRAERGAEVAAAELAKVLLSA